ncbi:unnamed protein product [Rotaria sordida]|uniref:Uncharacterized protein n=1 Tax=Rotaria sordida TaxID=392033 RepID=A0A816FPP8_9BILA|nr:unnamed protein product [Rotaria sordida]CAF1664491.1 unnamed protein product [Rotaria sordida]
MMINDKPVLGEFHINDYLLEQQSTYSSSTGTTGSSSIIIINVDDFVQRTLTVIRQLDIFIEAKQGVRGSDVTDGASAEYH